MALLRIVRPNVCCPRWSARTRNAAGALAYPRPIFLSRPSDHALRGGGCRGVAPPTRCFASRRDDRNREEKTWGEIAEEAADVARSAVGKVLDTGKAALNAVRKKRDEAPTKSETREQRGDVYRRPGGGLFEGLVGRAVGGLLGGALGAVRDQIQESQKEARSVYQTASSQVMNNEEIRRRLGDVQCGAPYSQQSSSSSINGVVTKRTVLAFPATGRTGTADIRAEAVEDRSGIQKLTITARMPDGRRIRVDDTGSGPGPGRTIDVEWKDV